MMLPITIFRVSGHSMLPTLRPGQFVLVNCWAQFKVGDLVVADDTQRGVKVIKRVKKIKGDLIYIEGDNHIHGGARIINKSQIVGRVILF